MDAEFLRKEIDKVLEPVQPLLWGVSTLDYKLPMEEQYEKVLTLVVPYSEMLQLDNYTEAYFRSLQMEAFVRLRMAKQLLAALFDKLGIRYGQIDHVNNGEEFEKNMTEMFNSKEAARKAGLGWIGKSNLLVTKEFGPRVNISELLCDIPIETGTPIEVSKCGKCTQCTDHCAFGAIYGKLWEPGVRREEQVDYAKCSQGRFKGYDTIGRKYSCGRCIVACPYGTREKTLS